ncbi:unnamed protein product [Gordionus sp. m RMFG-2023]
MSPKLQRWLLLVGSFDLEFSGAEAGRIICQTLCRDVERRGCGRNGGDNSHGGIEYVKRRSDHIWEIQKDKELNQVKECIMGRKPWIKAIEYKNVGRELTVMDEHVVRGNRAVLLGKFKGNGVNNVEVIKV